MVNTNIQGVVPINGRGYTARIKRNYQPGEYRTLSNARIEENIVQTRYNINHYLNEGAVSAPIQSAYPIAGFIDDKVIVSSKTEQFSYAIGTKKTLWAPTSLPTDGSVNSSHKIVGVFEYNNIWFWLTWRYDYSTNTHTMLLYSTAALSSGDVSLVTFAGLTATTLLTSTEPNFIYDNFFIYKERLWVTTNIGLYFSKATDPKVFATPDGGFFKLRDQNINYAFSHKENIFILCDSSIHSLTFNSNPNQDSYLREVTNVMGGDHGTSHKDQAYIINNDGLFAISPNSIELVRYDFEVGVSTPHAKLVSWEKYLIVLKYTTISLSGNALTGAKDKGQIRASQTYGTPDDPTVFFIDMETGSCHTLDFNDQFTGSGTLVSERGYVCDLIVNPTKSIDRTSFLTIMTTKHSGVNYTPSYSQLYRMDNTYNSFFIQDTVVNDPADNIIRRMKPNMKIEIHGYSPDGNEYMMKKFRSLELMGNFPIWDFEVLFAFDNQDYQDAKAILFTADLAGIEAVGDKRSPYPARIGLNQRARSVSVVLRTKNPRLPITGAPPYNIYERVEITDIRFLWTYTGRGPTHLTQSATT